MHRCWRSDQLACGSGSSLVKMNQGDSVIAAVVLPRPCVSEEKVEGLMLLSADEVEAVDQLVIMDLCLNAPLPSYL
jgi:hypothetical protein